MEPPPKAETHSSAHPRHPSLVPRPILRSGPPAPSSPSASTSSSSTLSTASASTATSTATSATNRTSAPKTLSLRWDEDTIRFHDAERGTRIKIDEPKTPYANYDSSNEELDCGSVTPLELARALACSMEPTKTSYAVGTRQAAHSGASVVVPPWPPSGSTSDWGSTTSDSGRECGDATPSSFSSYIGSSTETHNDRKRLFDEMRATHYNMKEAIVRARWRRQQQAAARHTTDPESEFRSGPHDQGSEDEEENEDVEIKQFKASVANHKNNTINIDKKQEMEEDQCDADNEDDDDNKERGGEA